MTDIRTLLTTVIGSVFQEDESNAEFAVRILHELRKAGYAVVPVEPAPMLEAERRLREQCAMWDVSDRTQRKWEPEARLPIRDALEILGEIDRLRN